MAPYAIPTRRVTAMSPQPSPFASLAALEQNFADGLATKALRGETLGPGDMRAFDVESCRRRVREFQAAHPKIAAPYVALFDELDQLLGLVTAIPPGSSVP